MGNWQQQLTGWLGNVTQPFGTNGETGIDIGVPYGTPVYAVTSGPVLGTGYYGGGGVVSIQTPINYQGISGPASIYYQHLSNIVVSAGQSVQAGDLIGYSGGQVGYGNHPSSSQFSTGPHIEIGINAPYGGMWHPLGNNVDPQGFFHALASGDTSVLGTGAGQPSPSTGDSTQTLGLHLPDLNPADWVNGVKTGFTDVAQRAGLAWFGSVLILIGIIVLFFSEAASHVQLPSSNGNSNGEGAAAGVGAAAGSSGGGGAEVAAAGAA